MEVISKDTKIDAEKLASILLARKITKPRFRWPLTYEQAKDVLLAAYKAEVQYRHRDFIADKHCIEKIGQLAQIITAENPKFGILLCGLCGLGKTTMMYAFRSALNILSDWQLFEERRGMRIMNAKDLAEIAKDYKSFTLIKQEPMLAIDDMGREPKEVLDYGNVLSPVVDLIEYRYNEQLFTLITTNLNPKEITERYTERIGDRFREMLEIITFGGSTFREDRQKSK